MPIDFDLLIDAPTDSVDMKAGLETLKGASDAVVIICDSILNKKTPKRITSKNKVRTRLKQTFKGSYGHVFSLEVYDDKLQRRLDDIGLDVFPELISYFIQQALYIDSAKLSDKALGVLKGLEGLEDEIEQQLRVSALRNIHKSATSFGYDTKLRFRKTRYNQTTLASFDEETVGVLSTNKARKIKITARVTRLNIFTGNGRLVVKGENETVAFGFPSGYKFQTKAVKRKLSENLNENNGVPDKDSKYLSLEVTPLKQQDGKTVKFLIAGID